MSPEPQPHYTIISFDRPDSTLLYVVDGPNVCPHCLALRLPTVIVEGSLRAQLLPSSVVIDNLPALKLRFAENWDIIEPAFADRDKLVADAINEKFADLLSIKPELLN